jgi:hypothetical protein
VVEQYLIWVLLVGVALGAAGTWFVIGRLPRRSEDISPPEMAAEAEWISQTIKRRGGVAPAPLVHEVLELHLDYLASEPLDVEPPDAETDPADAPPAPATSRAGAPPAEAARRPAGEPRGR